MGNASKEAGPSPQSIPCIDSLPSAFENVWPGASSNCLEDIYSNYIQLVPRITRSIDL